LIGGNATTGGNLETFAVELFILAIIEKFERWAYGWLKDQPGAHPPLNAAILIKKLIADLATHIGNCRHPKFI
jgi:hypothetical protein